jgi:LPXTG-motif cell wall-anchored protein
MNKNVILIGGAVALLGAGAFLYFKNKKKPNGAKDSSKTLAMSELAKAEESAESVKIKQDIKDLATSIKAKRDATIVLQSQMKPNNFLPNIAFNSAISNNIINIQNAINVDVAKLKELGYTELNGSAVKIG